MSALPWWNFQYKYRKQLTITAPVSNTVPIGYPVITTEDTSALQTAGKLLANRNDWRVVYWNGTSWNDLPRHYINTTKTIVGTKIAIGANLTDDNHFIYYGNALEGTNKQPTSDADWNGIYYPKNDGSIVGLWHCKESSGTTVVDTSASRNFSFVQGGGSITRIQGKFGYALDFPASHLTYLQTSAINLDRFTFQGWFLGAVSGGTILRLVDGGAGLAQTEMGIHSDNRVWATAWGSTGSNSTTTPTALVSNTVWHHIAIAFDGTSWFRFYQDGVLKHSAQLNTGGQVILRSTTSGIRSGHGYGGKMQNTRLTTLAQSSFPYAFTATPSVVAGLEEAPSGGSFILATL